MCGRCPIYTNTTVHVVFKQAIDRVKHACLDHL